MREDLAGINPAVELAMAKMYGEVFRIGDGPEDLGWSFDDGVTVTAEELQDCDSWDEIMNLVPEDLVFEAKGDGCRAGNFVSFLIRNSGYFRESNINHLVD